MHILSYGTGPGDYGVLVVQQFARRPSGQITRRKALDVITHPADEMTAVFSCLKRVQPYDSSPLSVQPFFFGRRCWLPVTTLVYLLLPEV